MNEDGSGKILLSTVYSKEMVSMMNAQTEQMRGAMGQMGKEEASSDVDPFYNENVLKFIAKLLGLDVSLSASRKYDKGGSRGFSAVYNFKDINAVRIGSDVTMLAYMMPQFSMMGDMEGMGQSEEDMFEMFESMSSEFVSASAVTFSLAQGDSNVLTVKIPELAPAKEVEEDAELSETDAMQSQMMASSMMGMGNPFGFTGEESQAQMMQKMFEGMVMSLDVQVLSDQASATQAIPRKGKPGRWIIYDMDFGKIAASSGGTRVMQSYEDMGMGGESMGIYTFGGMRNFDGATLQTNNLSISY
jgi:hypothetical protein